MTLATFFFIACLGFTAGLAAAGWARLMERVAGCDCTRHRICESCLRAMREADTKEAA